MTVRRPAIRFHAMCTAAVTVAAVVAGTSWAPAQSLSDQTVRGLVVDVDHARKRLVVSHDSIPGAMPAMTMPFDVSNGRDLDGIAPGMIVSFHLMLGKETAHIDQVRIVPYQSVQQDPLTARRLKLLTEIKTGRGSNALAVGQVVPDFTLTDQVRRTVTFSQFRGKVVAVNFVYTNCALPQFCFQMSSHFAAVRRRFQQRDDLTLLTVTFDPVRDTPEKLAAYAQQWNADPNGWHFLTGAVADVQRVAGIFGIDFFPDEGLVTHSVRTAIVDRQGRLAAAIDGNEFTATQLGDLVQAVLTR